MTENRKSDPLSLADLPGLDCGLCGSKTCGAFAEALARKPEDAERCIHLNREAAPPAAESMGTGQLCTGCGVEGGSFAPQDWKDSLGRDFDFILDSLPDDPGPREIIIPHNPARTAELDIQKGDVLIGRPMGMSCGCPVTHCGIAMDVDRMNGVITWCVTGPLNPRSRGYKDVGYYSAQAYEGAVSDAKTELKIGMRYFFMPHRCMLQWRHSGLINFINRFQGRQVVRLEGLFIG